MSSVRRVIVQAVWTPARICEQLRIPFHLSNTLLKKATGTKVACWGGGGGVVVVVVLARVTSHPHRTRWYKHTHHAATVMGLGIISPFTNLAGNQ